MVRLTFCALCLSGCAVLHGTSLLTFEELIVDTDYIVYGKLKINKEDAVFISRRGYDGHNTYYYGPLVSS
jgi:hypothetical protein